MIKTHLFSCKSVSFQSNEYRIGHCVCQKIHDITLHPVFGEIKEILACSDKTYLILEVLETVAYVEHYHAYELRKNPQPNYEVSCLENLHDYHSYSMHCHKFLASDSFFVVPKYDLL